MGRIVGAFGVSHTAMMIRKFDESNPDHGAVHSAFADIAGRIESLRPDSLVVLSSEHLKTFFLDNMPTFCIGTGATAEGWGEAGVPKHTVGVHQGLARGLLNGLVAREFDVSSSENFRLDHGFMAPLHLLIPEMDVPIVPVFENCVIPPLPSMKRCYGLGRAIREIIEKERPENERVAIVAAGGLSHWVAVPDMGRINEPFDRKFLDQVVCGDHGAIVAYDTETIEREAGNGGQEIRSWATMLGAVGKAPVEVLTYLPVKSWATGIALAAVDLAA